MTTVVAAPPRPDLAPLVTAPGTRVLVLGASRDDNAKVTLLLTPTGHRRPQIAVKTATTDGASRSILAEADVLRLLHRMSLKELRATVPTVLGVHVSQGRPALVCDVLAGTPLSVGYHRWRHTARRRPVLKDLTTVAAWLARFQELTQGPRALVTWPAVIREQLVQRHRDAVSLPAALRRLDQAAHELIDVTTPRTAVHGDLWVGNVLAHRGRITGVVDWECGALAGEPLRDLARLVLSYSLYLDRHTAPGGRVAGHAGLRADGWGDGVTYALSGRGWYPELVRAVLSHGLERLDVDPRHWRSVALVGLAEIAATADEARFALDHLDLLARQPSTLPEVRCEA